MDSFDVNAFDSLLAFDPAAWDFGSVVAPPPTGRGGQTSGQLGSGRPSSIRHIYVAREQEVSSSSSGPSGIRVSLKSFADLTSGDFTDTNLGVTDSRLVADDDEEAFLIMLGSIADEL